MQHVFCVEAVAVFAVDSAKLAVTASGKVQSTGWTNLRLSPRFCVAPPDDGILDIDFYAAEPTGVVLPIVSPITATLVINRDPMHYWGKGKPLTGARVHAATNSLEAKYDAENRQQGLILTAETIDGPLPLAVRAAHVFGNNKLDATPDEGPKCGLKGTISELLSKNLRAYRSGDSLGHDYRADRANIELDPDTLRIVHVWIG